MVLHIEKQDSQNLAGHATISGQHLGCKDSDVTLTPVLGNKYTITLSGLGCRGKGTLEHQGVVLKGKVKFETYHQAKTSRLNQVWILIYQYRYSRRVRNLPRLVNTLAFYVIER